MERLEQVKCQAARKKCRLMLQDLTSDLFWTLKDLYTTARYALAMTCSSKLLRASSSSFFSFASVTLGEQLSR